MGVVLTQSVPPLLRKIMKTQHWLIFPVYLDLFQWLKTPYCATKYAVTGFTDSLRMELESTSLM
jgi:NAD(P)-dependent dehydrogenase (short-subunit alcohol dehydrogenase family)